MSARERLEARFIPAGAGNTSLSSGLAVGWYGSSPRARGTPSNQHRIPGTPAVHPRGRGEHRAARSPRGASGPSSPRARGTPHCPRSAIPRQRFIPAGAGNTRRRRSRSQRRSVHPRGRGGTHLVYLAVDEDGRFIPAGAGNSRAARARRSVVPVHPRGRGELMRVAPNADGPVGSSPRARGTHADQRRAAAPRRFIPAGAGNSQEAEHPHGSAPVHPRGRGELGSPASIRSSTVGSSPRARGTLPISPVQDAHPRFIPAGAGNSRAQAAGATTTAVHPRGRGELHCDQGGGGAGDGSSPRARGTRSRARTSRPFPTVHPRGRGELALPQFAEHLTVRFIPAGAGNSQMRKHRELAETVHPRGRGELGGRGGSPISTNGSSPRARGTQHPVRMNAPVPRFIPAGAGNSGRSW